MATERGIAGDRRTAEKERSWSGEDDRERQVRAAAERGSRGAERGGAVCSQIRGAGRSGEAVSERRWLRGRCRDVGLGTGTDDFARRGEPEAAFNAGRGAALTLPA